MLQLAAVGLALALGAGAPPAKPGAGPAPAAKKAAPPSTPAAAPRPSPAAERRAPAASPGAGGLGPGELQLALGPSFISGAAAPTMLDLTAALAWPLGRGAPPLSYAFLTRASFLHYSAAAGYYAAAASGFSIVASARGRLALTPAIDVYGDAGLGLAVFWVTYDQLFKGPMTQSVTSPVLRFAGGVELEVSDRLTLFVEPLGLDLYLAQQTGNSLTVLLGGSWRL